MIKTVVTLAGYVWESGKDLIDAEVVLGSGDKTSSCKVVLSDPKHLVAAALINHAISLGGIRQLEGSTAAAAPATVTPVPATGTTTTNTTTKAGSTVSAATAAASGKTKNKSTIPKATNEGVTVVPAGNGTVSKGGVFDAKLRAFLDLIAYKEVLPGDILSLQGYYNNNGVGSSVGYFTDADIKAGGGFPASAKRKFNVGRYQFNRLDWEGAKQNGYPVKGFSPTEQDWVAVFKMQRQNKGWKELQAGDIRAAIKKAGIEWASLPGSPYGQVQSGYTVAQAVAYYEQRLAHHNGDRSVAAASSPSSAASTAKTTPAPSATDTTKPVVKGSPIVINIGGTQFVFTHQSTELTEAGQTTITGQGLRWQLSRAKWSATYKAIKLSELAKQIATKNKTTIEYTASFDPEYTHLDQTGMSDYQLLLRECDSNGLLLTEGKGKITITDRKRLKPPKLTLERGVNLISYKIQDKAHTGKEEDVSAIEPTASRTTIDPISGRVLSTGAKGKAKPAVAGTTATTTQAARNKRIGGLPSSFVIPLSAESLQTDPVSAVLTKGIVDTLDRVWLVRKVTHKLSDMTTSLECVSPVEVKDLVVPAATPKPTAATVPSGKAQGWIYPCDGVVTSLWNPRRKHPTTGKVKAHRGTDIGANIGTPLYAMRDGVVTNNAYDSGGGGNFVWVRTEDGYTYAFLHMDKPSSARVGQAVKQGEQIGLMGNTGIGTGSHLHVEIFRDRSNRPNPAEKLPKLAAKGNRITAKEQA